MKYCKKTNLIGVDHEISHKLGLAIKPLIDLEFNIFFWPRHLGRQVHYTINKHLVTGQPLVEMGHFIWVNCVFMDWI